MEAQIGSIDWSAVIVAAAESPLGIIALIIIVLAIAGYFMLRGTSEHYRFIAFVLLFFGGVALGAALVSERGNYLQADDSGFIFAPNVAVDSKTTSQRTPETSPASLPQGLLSQQSTPELDPASPMEHSVRERELSFYDRNQHCANPKDITWKVRAENGWKIDVTSIRIEVTVKSSRSNFTGFHNTTSSGFDLIGRLVNSGECIRVLGNTVARDGRGALGVSVRYKETAIESGT